VIKPRPIYLVFTNGSSRFDVQMSNVDVRKWVSGPVALAQQAVVHKDSTYSVLLFDALSVK